MNRSAHSVQAEDAIAHMSNTCVLMRTRLISRVITALHDEELRSFGIGSPQFVLLLVIHKVQPATRAEIGRYHHQDRSTLTRNLKLIVSEGWVEEVADQSGRGRQIILTKAGKDLLIKAEPAWQKAQTKSKAILRKAGVVAVTDIAKTIINTPLSS